MQNPELAAAAASPLDHGELNLPLSQRGGIDTMFGIRRADAERAHNAERKAAVAQRKADKARAKELLATHKEAIVVNLRAKFDERQLRDILDQWTKWEPARLIAFINKFNAETLLRASRIAEAA